MAPVRRFATTPRTGSSRCGNLPTGIRERLLCDAVPNPTAALYFDAGYEMPDPAYGAKRNGRNSNRMNSTFR